MITGPKDQPVVHPAVVEARGQRIVLHRLTAALALPDASGNAVPSARSASSAASNARRRTARLIERTG